MRKILLMWLMLYGSFIGFAQSDSIKIKNLYEEAKTNVYKYPKQAIKQIDVLITQSNINAKQLVDIYFLKSTAYSNLRDNEKALEHLNKTYELVNVLENKGQKVAAFHRISSIYHSLKLYDKSLVYLNEAEKTIQNLENKQEKLESVAYNCTVRGLIFKDLNNTNSAINYFNKAIRSYNQIENSFVANSNKSVIYYNLGYCYLKTDLNTAEKSFITSYELSKLTATKILIAYSLKGLGEYYFKLNNYETSNKKLNEALIVLGDIDDSVLQRNIYSLIGLNSIAQQEWKQFEKADSLSTLYAKKVLNSENKTISIAVQSLNHEAKVSTKKTLFNAQLVGIFSLFILILMTYVFYSKQKKLNKCILENQEELVDLLRQK